MPKNQGILKEILLYKFIYSMTGLLLGLASMIGGIILFLNGITGATSWTAKILGNESIITDAAPGAILFIVGLFIVIVTRYNSKIDDDGDKNKVDMEVTNK
jgi:hypothetical protein